MKKIKNKSAAALTLILILLIFAGCSKNEITVDDVNELPEDGIVSEEIISAFAGTDRTVSFCGVDKNTGIEYVWQLDGSKIKNPSEQNLKLTFETDGLENIKTLANDASYALEVETYGSGLVCSPVLTITVPESLDIDTAYLCKLDGGVLVIMSDITLEETGGAVSMSMNVVEIGDTYYIVGGLSGTDGMSVSDNSDAENESASDSETETGSDYSGSAADNYASNNTASGGGSDSGSGSSSGGAGSSSSGGNSTGSKNSSNSAGSDSGSSKSGGSSSTDSKSSSETSSVSTCTISINCSTILDNLDKLNEAKKDFVPSDGWILKATTVTIEDGDSVHDILKRVCKSKGIHMESSYTIAYNSAYIEGINQIYELDCGELSGWMYSVNGWFPNYSCSQYEVEDGDVIKFVYTCDLGRDVGNNSIAD